MYVNWGVFSVYDTPFTLRPHSTCIVLSNFPQFTVTTHPLFRISHRSTSLGVPISWLPTAIIIASWITSRKTELRLRYFSSLINNRTSSNICIQFIFVSNGCAMTKICTETKAKAPWSKVLYVRVAKPRVLNGADTDYTGLQMLTVQKLFWF
jgi:hypothetical protein